MTDRHTSNTATGSAICAGLKPLRYLAAAALLLVPVLSAQAQDAQPLLQYDFNQSAGNYTSSGSLKLPLAARGKDQAHGGPGSGVSGLPADRAWDTSANTTQGVETPANNTALTATPSASLFGDNLKAFTLAFWFKTEQSLNKDAATRFFVNSDRPTAPVGEGIALRSYNGRLELRIGGRNTNGQPQEAVVTSNRTKEGEGFNRVDTWVFVAITWDGRSVMYYIGTKDSPIIYSGGAAFTGSILPTSKPIVIGNTASFNRGLDGFIDNFRFYDAALPPPQLEQLRQADARGPQ